MCLTDFNMACLSAPKGELVITMKHAEIELEETIVPRLKKKELR